MLVVKSTTLESFITTCGEGIAGVDEINQSGVVQFFGGFICTL